MFCRTTAHPESLPWLDLVATGGQSHIFGTPAWVVKIPRRSWQTACGRILVHPATPVQALEVLGGLLEPFVLFERVSFRGPCVSHGRSVPSTSRVWNARWALAGSRRPAGDFLDQRIARATPGEAARLMLALLETLDAIRVRGWHVIDFIMSNFVVDADGSVRLVDAGLLIPVAHLVWPSQQICSRVFVQRMLTDYREVLAGVTIRHPVDTAGGLAVREVIDTLGPRLHSWRAGLNRRSQAGPGPSFAMVARSLQDVISAALAPARYKLPLTARHPSGYTPSHHAIASQN